MRLDLKTHKCESYMMVVIAKQKKEIEKLSKQNSEQKSEIDNLKKEKNLVKSA